jgi:FAD-dependent urate hydroxylase
VRLLCRRAEPTVVQPYRWLTFAGFIRHLHEMPDEWRWRFMARVLGMREGFAQDHYDRVRAVPNFSLETGSAVTGARAEDGRAALETLRGEVPADFVICGSGIRMDPALVPELSACAGNVALWSDRYAPPEEAEPRLAGFPYLAAASAFVEKRPGETPWIRDIHLFGIGTTMSFGPAGSSINAMAIAAPRLAAGGTHGLFEADLPRLWTEFGAYAVPQVALDPAP